MKFSSALTLLAASGVASASILERQVQTIIGVINGVNSVVGDLDTVVKGFSGDPKPLLAASQKALDTVNKGVETVNGASTVTLTDAVSIQGQVQNLQSTLESVVTDLIAKKEALITAGQGQITYKSLQDQLIGGKALAAGISSKVPPEVKSLADTLSQGVVTALEKGVAAFKDAPGGSSSTDSSSSSGGASTPSTPSSSSSPAAPAASSAAATMNMSGSSSSSGSASSGSSSSGSSSGSAAMAPVSAPSVAAPKPATASASSVPKPATYTGAAPRTVAGSFAVFSAALVALAL